MARLGELDFEVVVPGHGPVFRGRRQLEHLLRFFDRLVEHAVEAKASGWSEDEAAGRLDLASFRELLAGQDAQLQRVFDAFAPEAAARARAEARGELGDYDEQPGRP